MLDDTLLAEWCQLHLGQSVARVLFRSGFLSEVIGIELSGGLRTVVKARPFHPRNVGCVRVQAALADMEFLCPRPLSPVTRVDGMAVTAEAELSGGRFQPAEAGAGPFAGLLARLIVSAPAASTIANLAPSPGWAIAGGRTPGALSVDMDVRRTTTAAARREDILEARRLAP